MSYERLRDLLPAMEIAAFERRRDGSFAAVAPTPAWFRRLVADPTFPFLGHILDEATQFWATRVPSRREWGPCAEVDESGREFHYRVTAVTVANFQYLVFQLDTGSDEMRQVLQKVREKMLATEQSHPPAGRQQQMNAVGAAERDVRQAAQSLRAVVGTLLGATSVESRLELSKSVSAACDDLLNGVEALTRASAGGPRSDAP
jgi:hypothetical protein